MILASGVMPIEPFERRKHLAIFRSIARGPDQRFKVVQLKLGLGVRTHEQIRCVRPCASLVGVPRCPNSF